MAHREPERNIGVLLNKLHEIHGSAGVVQEGAAIFDMDALHQHAPVVTHLPYSAEHEHVPVQ
jgi:hypothetical protein